MTKVGRDVIEGLMEALAFAKGDRSKGRATRVFVPPEVDVRAIRKRTRLSQSAFAARFGLSVEAIENWEQGRRKPDVAARSYLTVIDRNPGAVERALGGAKSDAA